MSLGAINQLVINNERPDIFTTNPSITFFKPNYRKYVDFAKTEQQYQIQDAKFGGQIEFNLPKTDFINNLTLSIIIPEIKCKFMHWTKKQMKDKLSEYGFDWVINKDQYDELITDEDFENLIGEIINSKEELKRKPEEGGNIQKYIQELRNNKKKYENYLKKISNVMKDYATSLSYATLNNLFDIKYNCSQYTDLLNKVDKDFKNVINNGGNGNLNDILNELNKIDYGFYADNSFTEYVEGGINNFETLKKESEELKTNIINEIKKIVYRDIKNVQMFYKTVYAAINDACKTNNEKEQSKAIIITDDIFDNYQLYKVKTFLLNYDRFENKPIWKTKINEIKMKDDDNEAELIDTHVISGYWLSRKLKIIINGNRTALDVGDTENIDDIVNDIMHKMQISRIKECIVNCDKSLNYVIIDGITTFCELFDIINREYGDENKTYELFKMMRNEFRLTNDTYFYPYNRLQYTFCQLDDILVKKKNDKREELEKEGKNKEEIDAEINDIMLNYQDIIDANNKLIKNNYNILFDFANLFYANFKNIVAQTFTIENGYPNYNLIIQYIDEILEDDVISFINTEVAYYREFLNIIEKCKNDESIQEKEKVKDLLNGIEKIDITYKTSSCETAKEFNLKMYNDVKKMIDNDKIIIDENDKGENDKIIISENEISDTNDEKISDYYLALYNYFNDLIHSFSIDHFKDKILTDEIVVSIRNQILEDKIWDEKLRYDSINEDDETITIVKNGDIIYLINKKDKTITSNQTIHYSSFVDENDVINISYNGDNVRIDRTMKKITIYSEIANAVAIALKKMLVYIVRNFHDLLEDKLKTIDNTDNTDRTYEIINARCAKNVVSITNKEKYYKNDKVMFTLTHKQNEHQMITTEEGEEIIKKIDNYTVNNVSNGTITTFNYISTQQSNGEESDRIYGTIYNKINDEKEEYHYESVEYKENTYTFNDGDNKYKLLLNNNRYEFLINQAKKYEGECVKTSDKYIKLYDETNARTISFFDAEQMKDIDVDCIKIVIDNNQRIISYEKANTKSIVYSQFDSCVSDAYYINENDIEFIKVEGRAVYNDKKKGISESGNIVEREGKYFFNDNNETYFEIKDKTITEAGEQFTLVIVLAAYTKTISKVLNKSLVRADVYYDEVGDASFIWFDTNGNLTHVSDDVFVFEGESYTFDNDVYTTALNTENGRYYKIAKLDKTIKTYIIDKSDLSSIEESIQYNYAERKEENEDKENKNTEEQPTEETTETEETEEQPTEEQPTEEIEETTEETETQSSEETPYDVLILGTNKKWNDKDITSFDETTTKIIITTDKEEIIIDKINNTITKDRNIENIKYEDFDNIQLILVADNMNNNILIIDSSNKKITFDGMVMNWNDISWIDELVKGNVIGSTLTTECEKLNIYKNADKCYIKVITNSYLHYDSFIREEDEESIRYELASYSMEQKFFVYADKNKTVDVEDDNKKYFYATCDFHGIIIIGYIKEYEEIEVKDNKNVKITKRDEDKYVFVSTIEGCKISIDEKLQTVEIDISENDEPNSRCSYNYYITLDNMLVLISNIKDITEKVNNATAVQMCRTLTNDIMMNNLTTLVKTKGFDEDGNAIIDSLDTSSHRLINDANWLLNKNDVSKKAYSSITFSIIMMIIMNYRSTNINEILNNDEYSDENKKDFIDVIYKYLNQNTTYPYHFYYYVQNYLITDIANDQPDPNTKFYNEFIKFYYRIFKINCMNLIDVIHTITDKTTFSMLQSTISAYDGTDIIEFAKQSMTKAGLNADVVNQLFKHIYSIIDKDDKFEFFVSIIEQLFNAVDKDNDYNVVMMYLMNFIKDETKISKYQPITNVDNIGSFIQSNVNVYSKDELIKKDDEFIISSRNPTLSSIDNGNDYNGKQSFYRNDIVFKKICGKYGLKEPDGLTIYNSHIDSVHYDDFIKRYGIDENDIVKVDGELRLDSSANFYELSEFYTMTNNYITVNGSTTQTHDVANKTYAYEVIDSIKKVHTLNIIPTVQKRIDKYYKYIQGLVIMPTIIVENKTTDEINDIANNLYLYYYTILYDFKTTNLKPTFYIVNTITTSEYDIYKTMINDDNKISIAKIDTNDNKLYYYDFANKQLNKSITKPSTTGESEETETEQTGESGETKETEQTEESEEQTTKTEEQKTIEPMIVFSTQVLLDSSNDEYYFYCKVDSNGKYEFIKENKKLMYFLNCENIYNSTTNFDVITYTGDDYKTTNSNYQTKYNQRVDIGIVDTNKFIGQYTESTSQYFANGNLDFFILKVNENIYYYVVGTIEYDEEYFMEVNIKYDTASKSYYLISNDKITSDGFMSYLKRESVVCQVSQLNALVLITQKESIKKDVLNLYFVSPNDVINVVGFTTDRFNKFYIKHNDVDAFYDIADDKTISRAEDEYGKDKDYGKIDEGNIVIDFCFNHREDKQSEDEQSEDEQSTYVNTTYYTYRGGAEAVNYNLTAENYYMCNYTSYLNIVSFYNAIFENLANKPDGATLSDYLKKPIINENGGITLSNSLIYLDKYKDKKENKENDKKEDNKEEDKEDNKEEDNKEEDNKNDNRKIGEVRLNAYIYSPNMCALYYQEYEVKKKDSEGDNTENVETRYAFFKTVNPEKQSPHEYNILLNAQKDDVYKNGVIIQENVQENDNKYYASFKVKEVEKENGDKKEVLETDIIESFGISQNEKTYTYKATKDVTEINIELQNIYEHSLENLTSTAMYDITDYFKNLNVFAIKKYENMSSNQSTGFEIDTIVIDGLPDDKVFFTLQNNTKSEDDTKIDNYGNAFIIFDRTNKNENNRGYYDNSIVSFKYWSYKIQGELSQKYYEMICHNIMLFSLTDDTIFEVSTAFTEKEEMITKKDKDGNEITQTITVIDEIAQTIRPYRLINPKYKYFLCKTSTVKDIKDKAKLEYEYIDIFTKSLFTINNNILEEVNLDIGNYFFIASNGYKNFYINQEIIELNISDKSYQGYEGEYTNYVYANENDKPYFDINYCCININSLPLSSSDDTLAFRMDYIYHYEVDEKNNGTFIVIDKQENESNDGIFILKSDNINAINYDKAYIKYHNNYYRIDVNLLDGYTFYTSTYMGLNKVSVNDNVATVSVIKPNEVKEKYMIIVNKFANDYGNIYENINNVWVKNDKRYELWFDDDYHIDAIIDNKNDIINTFTNKDYDIKDGDEIMINNENKYEKFIVEKKDDNIILKNVVNLYSAESFNQYVNDVFTSIISKDSSFKQFVVVNAFVKEIYYYQSSLTIHEYIKMIYEKVIGKEFDETSNFNKYLINNNYHNIRYDSQISLQLYLSQIINDYYDYLTSIYITDITIYQNISSTIHKFNGKEQQYIYSINTELNAIEQDDESNYYDIIRANEVDYAVSKELINKKLDKTTNRKYVASYQTDMYKELINNKLDDKLIELFNKKETVKHKYDEDKTVDIENVNVFYDMYYSEVLNNEEMIRDNGNVNILKFIDALFNKIDDKGNKVYHYITDRFAQILVKSSNYDIAHTEYQYMFGKNRYEINVEQMQILMREIMDRIVSIYKLDEVGNKIIEESSEQESNEQETSEETNEQESSEETNEETNEESNQDSNEQETNEDSSEDSNKQESNPITSRKFTLKHYNTYSYSPIAYSVDIYSGDTKLSITMESEKEVKFVNENVVEFLFDALIVEIKRFLQTVTVIEQGNVVNDKVIEIIDEFRNTILSDNLKDVIHYKDVESGENVSSHIVFYDNEYKTLVANGFIITNDRFKQIDTDEEETNDSSKQESSESSKQQEEKIKYSKYDYLFTLTNFILHNYQQLFNNQYNVIFKRDYEDFQNPLKECNDYINNYYKIEDIEFNGETNIDYYVHSDTISSSLVPYTSLILNETISSYTNFYLYKDTFKYYSFTSQMNKYEKSTNIYYQIYNYFYDTVISSVNVAFHCEAVNGDCFESILRKNDSNVMVKILFDFKYVDEGQIDTLDTNSISFDKNVEYNMKSKYFDTKNIKLQDKILQLFMFHRIYYDILEKMDDIILPFINDISYKKNVLNIFDIFNYNSLTRDDEIEEIINKIVDDNKKNFMNIEKDKMFNNDYYTDDNLIKSCIDFLISKATNKDNIDGYDNLMKWYEKYVDGKDVNERILTILKKVYGLVESGTTENAKLQITPDILYHKYEDIIISQFNSFKTEMDFVRFLIYFLIEHSEFAKLVDIYNTSRNNHDIYDNIRNYYQEFIDDINEKLNKIEYDENTKPDNYSGCEEYIREIWEKHKKKIANNGWNEELGLYLIKKVDLVIGDQVIDTLTCDMMHIYYNMFVREEKRKGFDMMIGNVKELNSYDGSIKPKYQLLIPFFFFFNRYFQSSLPMIQLTNSSAKLRIHFNTFNNLFYHDEDAKVLSHKDLSDGFMIIDKITIAEEQRIKENSKMNRMLIDQHQYYKATFSLANLKKDIIKISNRWYGNSKEMMLMIRAKGNHLNDYLVSGKDIVKEIQIKYNEKIRQQFEDIKFYSLINKEHHTRNVGDGVYVYSFSLFPEDIQPSGSANMALIGETEIEMKLNMDIVNNMKEKVIEIIWINKNNNFINFIGGQGGLMYQNVELS